MVIIHDIRVINISKKTTITFGYILGYIEGKFLGQWLSVLKVPQSNTLPTKRFRPGPILKVFKSYCYCILQKDCGMSSAKMFTVPSVAE